MKATYNTDNTITELPEKKRPDATKILGPNPSGVEYEILDELQDEFEKHIASLRTIPVHGDHNWTVGQTLEEGRDYEVVYPEVDIYSKPGTKVKALFNGNCICNGYDFDKIHAEKYLKPDIIYELERSDVHNSHTNFHLKEFPGLVFNSVHFIYPQPVAVPLKVVGEDELWHKAIDLIMVAYDRKLSKDEAVSILKSQYSITKKK